MKTSYILFAVAALTLAACSKTNEQPEPDGIQMTFRAYQEGSPGTKTTVQNGGTQVYWEPADEIKVFFKGTGSRFISQNTAEATVADFSGSLNILVGANEGASSTTKIFGLYPYRSDATSDGSSVTTTLPAEQTGRAGSFAKNTHISLAATNANSVDLGFYNVTGGLRFSLTQEGIKSVTFQGNNGENLAGKIKLAFESGLPVVKEVTDGETLLILNAPGGGTFQTGKWYYIEAIPGTLSKGFKMVFSKGNETAKLNSSSSVTIGRGKYGSLADADEGIIFKETGSGDEPKPEAVADAVDLGLSVKWASFNVGATKPEDYGEYFAWGETEAKNEYRDENYKFAHIEITGGDDGSGFVSPITRKTTFDKYVPKSCAERYGYNGFYDDKTILDPEDDVAHVKWGGEWRMPTWSEFSELITNCTWTKGTYKGVNGYKVTSKKDGYTSKWIFFPAACYYAYTSLADGVTSCYYFASSLYESQPDYAWGISYQSNMYKSCPRWYGVPVRPVTE